MLKRPLNLVRNTIFEKADMANLRTNRFYKNEVKTHDSLSGYILFSFLKIQAYHFFFTDIDECANPSTCSSDETPVCRNFPGTYSCTTCSSLPGYQKYYGSKKCCKKNGKEYVRKRPCAVVKHKFCETITSTEDFSILHQIFF